MEGALSRQPSNLGDGEANGRRAVLDVVDEVISAAGQRGLTSEQVCDQLPVQFAEGEILRTLSRYSAKARTRRDVPRPFFNIDCQSALKGTVRLKGKSREIRFVRTLRKDQKVAYVSFRAWKQKHDTRELCPLCGRERKMPLWTLLGGRYYASTTAGAWAALLRQVLPIVMCEACYRGAFESRDRPHREVGVAVLPLLTSTTFQKILYSSAKTRAAALRIDCSSPVSTNVTAMGLSPGNYKLPASSSCATLSEIVRVVNAHGRSGCTLSEIVNSILDERKVRKMKHVTIEETPGKRSNF